MDSPYSPLPLLLENTSTCGKMWPNVAKCPQDEKSTKMKKLPDFFKKYNYFSSFDVKNIPGEKSFQAFLF